MEPILILATLCAFFVKGMCGFANSLIFTSILSFGYANVNITPMELLLGYPSNIIISWKERKSGNIKIWLPLALIVIAGDIPGMFFLKMGDVQWLKVFFGIVVVLVSVEMFLREYQSTKKKGSKVVLWIIGIVSGLLCGLYGIGALLAAYVGRTTEDSTSFKCNICMVFVMENTFRIIMYMILGIIHGDIFIEVLKAIPVMLLGLFIGMKCAGRIPESKVKKVVIIVLFISGLALVVTNL